jgi:hypothetical protein
MKAVFENLNSGDPSRIVTTVMELSTELSMAQESTIPSQVLDKLVLPLIKCLNMEAIPDIVCTFFC